MAESELFREFDFLPNLPKSDLDDRTFEDLVQECILRIPRYCPEWTNHNPGDPGITLIELFAWLVDQMLLRFNQVPRRNYVSFLELLGIRLQPPSAAQVALTFYLTKPVSADNINSAIQIPAGTEVATIRTETEPAVVFTTDHELSIDLPRIDGLFTAREIQNQQPNAEQFGDRLTSSGNDITWDNLDRNIFLFDPCEPGSCFYLVLSSSPQPGSSLNGISAANGHTAESAVEPSIAGHVVALTFKGVVAGTTGINPDDPPIQWEAWDGTQWQRGILRQRQDDRTKGFSFHELRQQGANFEQQGADVILHLPTQLPKTDFDTGCLGHWIRCTYTRRGETQATYARSPEIYGVSIRTLGGAVTAQECVQVQRELLGISTGKPGQTFQLQGVPVLERDRTAEYIIVKPPGQEDFERWEEVTDFGGSEPDSPHYVIDAQTGTVQFGPLVREPTQLQRQMQERSRIQAWGRKFQRMSLARDSINTPLISSDAEAANYQEWQYGKVPPRGADIYMSAYRVGGGSRGNVQAEKLTILKTAIPYVKQVINYRPALGGREGESLDEAVIRVPQILRTAKAAIIPEDFEAIALRSQRAIYRAYCPPCDSPGLVRLLVVPDPTGTANPHEVDVGAEFPRGMHPDQHFTLNDARGQRMKADLMKELEQRKPLGIHVRIEQPIYVGVKVFAEVLLDINYRTPSLRETIQHRLRTVLYRFLNPITGGFEGDGWSWGRAVAPSDIIALLQDMPEVQYVGAAKLFGIRKYPIQGWLMDEFPDLAIDPGSLGLISSWEDDSSSFNSGHEIVFMD